MTREEYEERKRLIEAQHRATIELIEAGREAQLRALELVWLGGAGEVPLLAQEAVPAVGEGDRMPPTAPIAPDPETSAPAGRRKAWQVIEEIEEALEVLPEVFDHHDLCQALGYPLDRGVARRNLKLLVEEDVLAMESSESGRFRLRYRKLGPSAAQEPE